MRFSKKGHLLFKTKKILMKFTLKYKTYVTKAESFKKSLSVIKLECFLSLNTVVGSYLQHFILFVTFECDHYAGVLHYQRLQMLARDKHSNLLDPFVIYRENKAL